MGLYQGDKPLSSIGKSPAAYAKDAGYTGTDDNFYTALANMPEHLSNQENPHGTTASQVGAYSKEETDMLLQAKVDVPITSTPDDDTTIWIDPDEDDQTESFYTKAETNELLQNKADLIDGKVRVEQLPTMDYATKQDLNNKADLIDGKVPVEQLPTMDYAPAYTYGTEDLTAGTSALETGKMYIVYEP